MCLILASPSYSLQGIALNKRSLPPLASFVSWPSAFVFSARHSPEQVLSPPSLLLNESVLCLVVVWVDSLQPVGAFMSLIAKLHKILE